MYQGIGRRLWYTGKGDFEKVNLLINKFSESRKIDLWKGVGLACGYVGGIKAGILSKFNKIEERFQSHFNTGYILTTIHNIKSKRIEVESLNNCTLLCGLNNEDIFYLSKCIEVESSKKSINSMLLLIENKKNEIYKSYES